MNIVEKGRLLKECRLVTNVFNTINQAIKSVADSALRSNKNEIIMTDAIKKIFNNFNMNIGETLKRWRNVNNIERLRSKISG